MEAERLGLQVSDADVAESIRQMVPSLFPDGKFVGKDAYAAMLAQQNMTIDQFESDLKRQVMITRLRDIALEGTIVTQAEIEAAFRKKNEKIKVEFVRLTADKYKAESQPTAQEMQDFYKANPARYTSPEKKNLTVLVADQAKMEATVNATDADLQRMYSQNQEAFRTPERVKARHILLKTQGKPASEEAAIKAKGENLLKQIKGGADFAKLAKENSEDPGSGANGGDLGDWITHGQMVAEFDKAIFSLKAGETSDLVKTVYGYHIVQTLARQDAGVRTFAEVKGELAAQWKKQRVNDLMQQASDKAQAALQKDPAHPEKVAADYNMQVVRVDNYAAGTPVPELGPSADFDQAVAALKKGEVSQAVSAGTKVALAMVNDVIPAHPSSFEEVQNQIRDLMVQNRSAAAVQKHANELDRKGQGHGRRSGQGGQVDGAGYQDFQRGRPRRQYRGNRHGQLRVRGLHPAGRHRLRTDGLAGWRHHRGQGDLPRRRGFVATAGAAQHHSRRDQEPARPRAQHAVRKRREGHVDQTGQDQDPSGRDQPADRQLPYQLANDSNSHRLPAVAHRPGQTDPTVALMAAERE